MYSMSGLLSMFCYIYFDSIAISLTKNCNETESKQKTQSSYFYF